MARPALAFLLCVIGCWAASVPVDKPSAYPAWWFEREVVPQTAQPPKLDPSWPGDYRAPDDFAAANLGQLKQIATKAAAELNVHLPGGAGPDVNSLIAKWTAPPNAGGMRDDFAAVNLGQLKAVARVFYDRLWAVGYSPWLPGRLSPRSIPRPTAAACLWAGWSK